MLAQEGYRSYYLGVGGYPKDGAVGKNDGAWWTMFEKKSSIEDKLRLRNRMIESEPIFTIVEDVLREQADVRNIRIELGSL